jgi:hypothetical protein
MEEAIARLRFFFSWLRPKNGTTCSMNVTADKVVCSVVNCEGTVSCVPLYLDTLVHKRTRGSSNMVNKFVVWTHLEDKLIIDIVFAHV